MLSPLCHTLTDGPALRLRRLNPSTMCCSIALTDDVPLRDTLEKHSAVLVTHAVLRWRSSRRIWKRLRGRDGKRGWHRFG